MPKPKLPPDRNPNDHEPYYPPEGYSWARTGAINGRLHLSHGFDWGQTSICGVGVGSGQMEGAWRLSELCPKCKRWLLTQQAWLDEYTEDAS